MDVSFDLLKLAQLARLSVSEDEREDVERDLRSILEFAEGLYSGPEEDAVDSGGESVLREDRVLPSLPRDRALSGAPETKDGCFLLPRVIE